ACQSWTYNGKMVSVMPAGPGYALHIDGAKGNVVVSDMGFIAVQGTATARSSIATFVSRSTNVLFRRALHQALPGAAGAAGVRGVAGKHNQNPDGMSSNSTDLGGVTRLCTCVGGNGGMTF